MSIKKREIEFAVFGFGITLSLALFYFAQPEFAADPTSDGTLQFVQGLGCGFQAS